MNTEKFLPLVKGIAKKLLVARKYSPVTGGTDDSRYCYTVWMRHLIFAYNNGIKNIGETVAELGPGDSLGIGLTALLTGCSKYYALDVYKYWNVERNLEIFDKIVLLLKNRTAIPADKEFPRVTPSLPYTDFPSHILTDELLQKALAPERLNRIRNEISALEKQNPEGIIKYFIPWNDQNVIKKGSVDFIFSQAVLQYVNDLDATYAAMNGWLKTGGIMSHSIDFSSHGITSSWNGHWTFSDAQWKLAHGNNKILLNRAPLSLHLQLNKKYHFDIINKEDYKKENRFSNNQFTKQFRNLTKEDAETFVSVIQSVKRNDV